MWGRRWVLKTIRAPTGSKSDVTRRLRSVTPFTAQTQCDSHSRVQEPAVFELPEPWSHKRCKRHIGGWPYIHLFHHYLKI